MALINREYHPSPPKEEPKWWEVRERLRTTLESRGWEPDQIQRWLGKNVEEFQRMNELREEAGMEPVSGAYAVPHMLGKLDVVLGATSLPAFTKTLGQAALPYAAMMGESALATTDIGRGMKEWPEDQPKDWRYALMVAGLPLAGLGGGMATRQLVSKIPPAPTPKGIQTLKSTSEKRTGALYSGTKRILSEEEALERSDRFVNIKSEGRSFGAHKKGGETNWFIDPETNELFKWSSGEGTIPRGFHLVRGSGYDPVRKENFIPKFVRKAQQESKTPEQVNEMRRKILQGTVAGGALAAVPAGLRTLSKAGPPAARVAGTVTPAAGKSFIGMMGSNTLKPNLGRKLSESVDEYVYRRVPSAKDHETSLPITKKLYPSYDKSDTDAIKVFIDDNYNVTTTFKDLQKGAKSQAFGEETIHRHLADNANIIDIETIAHTGKNHFKNYGLKPDEIHIIGEYDFDGFVPRKDFTTNPGTRFETAYTKDASLFDTGLQRIDEVEDYLKQHGRKINKDVDPGIPYEAGDMGFVDISYYEVDGVPVAIGRYTAEEKYSPLDRGDFDAIIMPNKKGLKRLTGMSEEEIDDIMANAMETDFAPYTGASNE